MKHVKKTVGTKKTENYMGEPAYVLHDEERLLNLVATCLMNEPKYYGSTGKVETEIRELCEKLHSEYILQLALYARRSLHLRSTPIYLLAVAAHIPETKQFVRMYTPYIIQRADEINEVLACYLAYFKKPVPNSLKKGVAAAFKNFDEYQFAKYNRDGTVKFKDAIMITHPRKPSKIIKKILDGKLETPKTWEVELSAKGNKREVWDELVREKKLGYMATLRNLNNMLKADILSWPKVIDYLTNEKAIANSKQLPHRFLSAYEAIGGDVPKAEMKFENERNADMVPKLQDALNTAMRLAAEHNIPKIPGKTIILADNSGSARGDYGGESKPSSKSIRSMADIGNLLGLLTWYSCENTMFCTFGDKLIQAQPDRKVGILDNFRKVDEAGKRVGESTEQGVFTMLERMIEDKIMVDRLVVCSDLQIGDGRDQEYGLDRHRKGNTVPKLLAQYREEVNPNLMYYSVCFNGYGTDVVMGEKKVLISGFSDNILRFIAQHEQNGATQIQHIKTMGMEEHSDKNEHSNEEP